MKILPIFLCSLCLGVTGCFDLGSLSKGGDDESASKRNIEQGVKNYETGSAQLRWLRPLERANGDYLHPDELGGYELRYRLKSEADFDYVVIEDPWLDEYELTELHGEDPALKYEFQVAAFDRNGLYSGFVTLTPYN